MRVAVVNIVYSFELAEWEREHVRSVVADPRSGAQKRSRAQILLAVDRGVPDCTIAETLDCSESTIYRTKRRLVIEGLLAALSEKPRRGGRRKLSGNEVATLVAIACSDPPEGRACWTLQLLADALVLRSDHERISKETIRRRLSENALKPWLRKMWCIRKVDAEFVARMEDVLDLYCAPPDSKRPVVCFDETPIQLISETRVPVPAKPRRVARVD